MSNKVAQLVVQTSTGILIVLIIVLSRLVGLLEPLELFWFDLILKTKQPELQDNHIALIEISSIESVNGHGSKLSPQDLIDAISQLQIHEPAVIGLNIPTDLIDSSDDSFKELSDFVSRHSNIISAEGFLPPFIDPLLGVDPNKVGFVDVFIDQDYYVRRMPLGSFDLQDETQFKYSFSFLLAKVYLEEYGHSLENGILDEEAMRFGDIEISKIYPNTGGYSRIDDVGIQTMVNYRTSQLPFKVINFQTLKERKLKPSDIENRLVIIGVTDVKKRFRIKTPVDSQMDGLNLTGHFTSQIINSVLEDRFLIKPSKEVFEYFLIILSGITIIYFCNQQLSTFQLIAIETFLLISLILISYILLAFYGYWIAIIPPLLILSLNLLAHLSSTYQNNMRRKVIERTFEVIHNGPLQTLSIILNNVRNDQVKNIDLENDLKQLSLDIRGIGEELRGESLSYEQSLSLTSSNRENLDLSEDLHELFYQVYSITLKRNFLNFRKIKTKIRSFEAVSIKKNSFSLKRELCMYLEEAICNAGKHSVNPTKLIVKGEYNKGFYTLLVQDNGIIKTGCRSIVGQGTKNASKLARKLRGQFERKSLPKKGTTCKLMWKP